MAQIFYDDREQQRIDKATYALQGAFANYAEYQQRAEQLRQANKAREISASIEGKRTDEQARHNQALETRQQTNDALNRDFQERRESRYQQKDDAGTQYNDDKLKLERDKIDAKTQAASDSKAAAYKFVDKYGDEESKDFFMATGKIHPKLTRAASDAGIGTGGDSAKDRAWRLKGIDAEIEDTEKDRHRSDAEIKAIMGTKKRASELPAAQAALKGSESKLADLRKQRNVLFPPTNGEVLHAGDTGQFKQTDHPEIKAAGMIRLAIQQGLLNPDGTPKQQQPAQAPAQPQQPPAQGAAPAAPVAPAAGQGPVVAAPAVSYTPEQRTTALGNAAAERGIKLDAINSFPPPRMSEVAALKERLAQEFSDPNKQRDEYYRRMVLAGRNPMAPALPDMQPPAAPMPQTQPAAAPAPQGQ